MSQNTLSNFVYRCKLSCRLLFILNEVRECKMSSLSKGTAILTLGLSLSKVLAVIYLIPFYSMVGEDNLGLYQSAYIPYHLMPALAISGAPIAFSTFTAKYNSLGDYAPGRRLLLSGLLTMVAT